MSPEKGPIKSEAPSNISENDKILKKLQEAVGTQNKENLMAELEKPENKDKIGNIVRTMSIDGILGKEFKLLNEQEKNIVLLKYAFNVNNGEIPKIKEGKISLEDIFKTVQTLQKIENSNKTPDKNNENISTITKLLEKANGEKNNSEKMQVLKECLKQSESIVLTKGELIEGINQIDKVINSFIGNTFIDTEIKNALPEIKTLLTKTAIK
ncbi:hypothetical protein KAZ01_02550, partial [Candidatus Gracilibacteria bacterium]|nr:hypothetical protein [Candidatus Gracilibacteria bacterium]